MTRPVRGTRAAARGIAAALGALASLTVGFATGGPAVAAPAPAVPAVPAVPDGGIATYNAVTRISTDGLGFQWDNGRDASRVSTFQSAHSSLKRTGINGVLADTSNVTSARSLCHPSNIAGAQGFCWSSEDDGTTAWYPQGLAGSGESPQAQTLVNGRKVLIAGWSASGDKRERITFADVTDPSHVTYRHALLVGLSDDSKNFAALGGHANGVVWAGSRLYVASIGSGFDVFDLNGIWKMDTTVDASVGVDASGRTHGGGFDYVLPRTGSYAYTGAGGEGCGTYPPANVQQRPCLTAASLDLSGPQPALVTAEGDPYSVEDKFGKATAPVVRWPIDPVTGRLKADASGRVQASEAFASPMGGTQGIAMNNGRFAIAGPCPEFVDAKNGGVDIPSCLYHARPDEPVRLVMRTGVNIENLSYWPGSDELWIANEAGDRRMVVHTSWPDDPAPVGMARLASADFTGDGKPDLVGIETATGKLWLYPGTGSGTFGDRIQIGTGWGGLSKLTAGDFTGDGKADLLAVDSDTGILYAYPGTGAAKGMSTLGDRVRIGTGWNTMRELTTMDADRNGKPDLLAVDKDGVLWAYPGSGSLDGGNTLGGRVRIDSGWDTMTELTSPGDLDADGKADLVAVDRDGDLWAYPGSGSLDGGNALGDRARIGTGWDTMRQLVGADFNRDGKGDVDAVEAPAGATGSLYFYPGTGTGTNALGDRARIGTGW
ncbi:VCBS repeat-containing protein [Streptomyces roseoverticillatus]|uniref:FG-GAP repeat domain-containing protein n=1 Tax=Streptomyces roseoverticillatus TaxID=66429 RepID=UPI001F289ADB|nr:VCBS repeat-containing protein [Streptomyces roseoverticillatus]MCF3106565.1 VCBS repeat-containing protein [Streptomyces roseoverticillatus]